MMTKEQTEYVINVLTAYRDKVFTSQGITGTNSEYDTLGEVISAIDELTDLIKLLI